MPENQEKKDMERLKAEYDEYMQVRIDTEKQNRDKYEQFKDRISQFAGVKTLKDAKILSEKILPVSQELNQFKVGLGTCTIINRNDLLRISLNSEKEFICYNFV